MAQVRLVVAAASVALVAACTGGGGGNHPAQPAATPSNGPELVTDARYSGSYDETLTYTASSPAGNNTVAAHVHFVFSESVMLTTPRDRLTGKPLGTPPVSDSADQPVLFSDTGTMTYRNAPAHGQDCAATYTGRTGVKDWPTAGGQPPIEVAIAAVTAQGAPAPSFAIQVSAAAPGGSASRVITTQQTGADTSGTSSCASQGPLGSLEGSPGIFGDAQYLGFARPGPRENPLLVLPLGTTGWTRSYAIAKTTPYTLPGISGTDTVQARGTLVVNGLGGGYAAIGDSYSSGDTLPFLDDCKRSDAAFPQRYDPGKAVFLACSGATSAQVLGSQVPQVPVTTKVVSVTAGGDDVDVFGLLVKCVATQALPDSCASRSGITAGTWSSLQSALVTLYKAIHEQAPDAKVYVLGYPNPMPATYPSTGCTGLTKYGQSVAAKDVPFFHGVVETLDQTVAQAATASGVATYVAPPPAFAQHDVCAAQPWFFRGDSTQGAPAHPNQAGHQQLAAALLAAAGPPPQVP